MNSSDLTFSTLHFQKKNSVSILSGSPSRRPSDSEVVTGGQVPGSTFGPTFNGCRFSPAMAKGREPGDALKGMALWQASKEGGGLNSPSQPRPLCCPCVSVIQPFQHLFPPQNSNVLLSTCNSVCLSVAMSEEGDYENAMACLLACPSVRLSCPGDLGRAAAAGGLLEFDDPRRCKDVIVLRPIICR